MACSLMPQTAMHLAVPENAAMPATPEHQLTFHRLLRPHYAYGRHQKISRKIRNAKIDIFEDTPVNDGTETNARREISSAQAEIKSTEVNFRSKNHSSTTTTSRQTTNIPIKPFQSPPHIYTNVHVPSNQYSISRARSSDRSTAAVSVAKSSSKGVRPLTTSPNLSRLELTPSKPLREAHQHNNNIAAHDWFGCDTGKENVPPGLQSEKLCVDKISGCRTMSKRSQSQADPDSTSRKAVTILPLDRSLQTAVNLTSVTTSSEIDAKDAMQLNVETVVDVLILSQPSSPTHKPSNRHMDQQRSRSPQYWILDEVQVVARLASCDLQNPIHRQHRLEVVGFLAVQIARFLGTASVTPKPSQAVRRRLVLRLAKQAEVGFDSAGSHSTMQSREHFVFPWLNNFCCHLLKAMFDTLSSQRLAVAGLGDDSTCQAS